MDSGQDQMEFRWRELLTQARAALLDESDLSPRHRLSVASHHFWRATWFAPMYSEWNQTSRELAEKLIDRLLSRGRLETTITSMHQDELHETTQDILRLCEQVLAKETKECPQHY